MAIDNDVLKKYDVALAVLDEVLPGREFMGPLFDTRIQTMRAKAADLSEKLVDSINFILNANYEIDRRPLDDMRAMLEMDSAEIDELTKTAETKLAALPAPPQYPQGGDVVEWLAEVDAWNQQHAEIVRLKEDIDLAIEALRDYSSDNITLYGVVLVGFCKSTGAEAGVVRAQIGQMKALQALRRQLLVALEGGVPEGNALKILLKKVLHKKTESAIEELSKDVVLIGSLVPLLSVFFGTYKEWRDEQVTMEKAVARVRSLILIRQIIVAWEDGGLKEVLLTSPPAPKAESPFDILGMKVSAFHEQWQNDKESLQKAIDGQR